jgi:sterol desaturase/sphingolipid hydroxylase (fatty acid hydroxylase superfamily)
MNTIHNTNKARIFENPFLEALTKTSPTITLVFYSALAITLITAGSFAVHPSVLRVALYFTGGLLFWSFFEYIMHRYIFHISEHIKGTERFQFIVHGVHHQHPKDEERVFMPPVPGAIVAMVLLGINFLIMGKNTFFFTGGMIIGYMIYACIHYAVHNKPVNPRFRKLWQHHAMHHYKYPDKAFGVSSPLWDMVFGTMPPKK